MVRRLHDNTAARLERKLFADSDDLQKQWQQQVAQNKPTGALEINLVHQAYEKWVHEYLDPIGKMSIEMLSIGVVAMFVTAGILVHNIYLLEYNNFAAVPIFWTTVGITSITMLSMKFSEDRKERKKEGVYDMSWQDEITRASGPFAKIDKAAKELSNSTAAALGSLERVQSYRQREKNEIGFCTKTQLLNEKVQSLRNEAENRAKIRKEVLQLLTTATEELDSLPEDLISRTNKILHSTDEADLCNANFVTTFGERQISAHEGEKYSLNTSRSIYQSSSNGKMGIYPIDAQRLPVSLVSLRKKLGEISHTTLLRLRNTSDQPLRMKSGVQLTDGKYITSIDATDPHGKPTCFHLYPGTEIPPRTEVLVAARSRGRWFSISGIKGKIVYTNYDESWTFEVAFRNDLVGNIRRSSVKAYATSGEDEDAIGPNEKRKQYWQISKDEYDAKANNEIAITFDALHTESTKMSYRQSQSSLTLKSGVVFKKGRLGLGLQWQQLWCVLTPIEIILSKRVSNEKQEKISLLFITKVAEASKFNSENVLEIHTTLGQHYLSTRSQKERNDWIKSISDAVELISSTANENSEDGKVESKESPLAKTVVTWAPDMYHSPLQSYIEESVECVHQDKNTEILTE